ncbi:MAG: cold-shock protein [Bacteroidales bacterium]
MGRSQESFNKKEVRKRKEKKRKEKAEKREARKDHEPGSSLDDMIAYVDEYGNITDTPPDPNEKEEIDVEDIVISTPKKVAEEEGAERTGTISFYNDQKGFGFIKDSGSRQDVFFHINNCHDDVKEGNRVSFETEQGPKGPAAVNVKLIK